MGKQTVRFKDCGIYYERYLNPGKPFVVMLHSFASSGKIFKDQILAIKHQYQIIVVDLPGHGKSEYSKHVKIKDMPEILNMIFSVEKIDKAHFVGITEGSLVAQAFGHLFPNRVTSLVAISSISIFHDSHKALSSSLFFTNLTLGFLRIFSFNHFKNWYINRSANTYNGKQIFKESMEGFKRRSHNVLKGLKRFYSFTNYNVNYPTYLVCGENDLEVIKDASFQFEQKVPKTTLEGFVNSKQIVFLDEGRFFNDRLKLFLNNIDEYGE